MLHQNKTGRLLIHSKVDAGKMRWNCRRSWIVPCSLHVSWTHHADAFLQNTPHAEVVPGDHLRRQRFPGTHLDQIRLNCFWGIRRKKHVFVAVSLLTAVFLTAEKLKSIMWLTTAATQTGSAEEVLTDWHVKNAVTRASSDSTCENMHDEDPEPTLTGSPHVLTCLLSYKHAGVGRGLTSYTLSSC